MAGNQSSIAEIEDRMAVVRESLRDLVEQAAAYSGSGDEDATSDRIAEYQAELELLTKQLEQLSPPTRYDTE